MVTHQRRRRDRAPSGPRGAAGPSRSWRPTPACARELVKRQRAWAAGRDGGVVEGRDIGSVVFPEATVKVYLTASPEERARRRGQRRVGRRGGPPGPARLDPGGLAPDPRPPDAHLLDTTGRSVEDVVEEVLSWL